MIAHGDEREGKWRGKLANGVGSQYPSHYLGTWFIQHYYRSCSHLGCQQSTELTPLGWFKWNRLFHRKTKFCFCACDITFQLASNASLTFTNSAFCSHTVCMHFVRIWEQTAIISLYSINWLICITQRESVYCAVRAECWTTIQVKTDLQRLKQCLGRKLISANVVICEAYGS